MLPFAIQHSSFHNITLSLPVTIPVWHPTMVGYGRKAAGRGLQWNLYITMTSQWARWRLKSPALPLFTQPFIRHRSKKTWKLRVTGHCAGNSPGTGEFPPHKWPVMRKIFPFDDGIMRKIRILWMVLQARWNVTKGKYIMIKAMILRQAGCL